MNQSTQDLDTLKARLKATWMAGDFGLIAKSYETGAADFVHRLGLTAANQVLDVACGTGNLTLPALRTGASVVGIDIASNLLDQARSRAKQEGLSAQLDEGDAEELPYADASFDTVMSMFGVMFTPRPEVVSAELVRVCQPGGRIALANWSPAGFIGQMFKLIASHVRPTGAVPSPILWGEETPVRDRLGAGCSELKFTPRMIALEFPYAPSEMVELWRIYYGPTNRAFEALSADPNRQSALRADLEQLWTNHNLSSGGSTRVESEYLEVLATRKPSG